MSDIQVNPPLGTEGGGGPPTGKAGGDLEGEYPNPTVAPEKITTGKIKLLAITTALIEALNVTTAKIAEGAVTAAKLGAESVETAKIKLLAITTALLAEEAVTTAKIGKEQVKEANIGPLAVTGAKVGNAALSGKQIKVGTAEAPKELKELTAIEPSAAESTTVYLSLLLAIEKVAFEVIADGVSIYKYREELIAAASANVNLAFRLKAGAKFEVKTTAGKIETATTTKSVYTFQSN